MCGNPFLDFDSLQKNARYEGGYSAGEPPPNKKRKGAEAAKEGRRT